jgi:integrase
LISKEIVWCPQAGNEFPIRLMERRGIQARPRGLRSSLRDWMAEATNTPRDIAETMLGHSVGGAVERAYRRTDFFARRRAIMERWALVVTGKTDAVNCLADAA